jgi:hypothetical protein
VDDHFAASWIEAWNAHDVDRVLRHFTDDVVFASPLVPVVAGRENPLRGQDELRAYWTEGLRQLPELRFSLERVYVGVDTVGIAYRNERGRPALEMLSFGDDGRAARGWALYGPDAAPRSSPSPSERRGSP